MASSGIWSGQPLVDQSYLHPISVSVAQRHPSFLLGVAQSRCDVYLRNVALNIHAPVEVFAY